MSTDAPIGLIAGEGALPFDLIDVLKSEGRAYIVAGLEGFADPDVVQQDHDFMIGIGKLGTFIDKFQDAGVEQLLMAGKVVRPSLRNLKTDRVGAKFLLKIGFKSLGDNSLLELIKTELATYGFSIVGIEDVTSHLMVQAGLLNAVKPSNQALDDMDLGVEVAKAIGALDIGQAVVVHDGEVLAVEAAEGTDALIKRSADLRRWEGGGGALVKAVKPQQCRDLDLPTIGLQTLKHAVEAGLEMVALEANGALLLKRDECIRFADENGLSLYGF